MKFLYDIVICLIVYLLIMQSNIIHMIGEYTGAIINKKSLDNEKNDIINGINQ